MRPHGFHRVHLVRVNHFGSGHTRYLRHSLELLLDRKRLLVFAEAVAQLPQKRRDDGMFHSMDLTSQSQKEFPQRNTAR
jgi:hypothetical protein